MSITNGTYAARATGEVLLGQSAQKGTPFIEMFFTVAEGPCAGQKVRWTGYFTERTQKRTIEALVACGWTGEDLEEFADGELHGLGNNIVDIVVELEEYAGKDGTPRTSPKVQWVNKKGSHIGLNLNNAMKPSEVRTFSERLRGIVVATRQAEEQNDTFAFGNGAAPPPPAQPEVAPLAGQGSVRRRAF